MDSRVELWRLCPCRQRLTGGGCGGAGGGEDKSDSGDVFLYSPLKVVIFVGLMCGMLVLMYFFYNVLGECNLSSVRKRKHVPHEWRRA